jgi:site-specific DNA recombinase
MNAAAYARYSTDRQQKNSIEYQLDEIRRYCAENSINITATFTDEGKSGTNTDRSDFQAMLEAAKRKEFDAVVIYDITRGSRDVGDWFAFRKQMMRLGVTVISATQQLGDLTKSSDFLVELLNVGMGQYEVLETRQKSIAGVAVKAKEGVFLGGTPPLGYDIVKGRYVINEGEARLVRKIFESYGSGGSYDEILASLGGALGKMGRPIGKNSLHSILTNERYIGVYTWNKRQVKLFRQWAGGGPNPNCVRIEGAIPVIIDDLTWERVQKRLNDNRRNATNKAKRTYLLSGLIECEECGATYVGHTSTNKKGVETRYYVCGNKYRTKTCSAKNINASEIEGFVLDGLKRYFLELDFEAEAQRIADMVNGSSVDLRAERSELASIEAKLANGLRAILNGMDNFPELQDEMDRLRVRKRELEEIIARRTASKKAVNPADIIKVFNYALDHWDDDLPTIVREHITKIYAHTDGSYSVNVGVHISGCGGPRHFVCTTAFQRSA